MVAIITQYGFSHLDKPLLIGRRLLLLPLHDRSERDGSRRVVRSHVGADLRSATVAIGAAQERPWWPRNRCIGWSHLLPDNGQRMVRPSCTQQRRSSTDRFGRQVFVRTGRITRDCLHAPHNHSPSSCRCHCPDCRYAIFCSSVSAYVAAQSSISRLVTGGDTIFDAGYWYVLTTLLGLTIMLSVALVWNNMPRAPHMRYPRYWI